MIEKDQGAADRPARQHVAAFVFLEGARPAAGYSYARVIGRDGRFQYPSMWSLSVIKHLFDAIKKATGNQSAQYLIYGHSEGGQFVHRLMLLLPDARYARAVAANPGWHTMPRFDIKFPYGLGGSPATKRSLKKSLGRGFVLLLGNRDTGPNHKDLRKTPQAMAQGASRFERGQNFFKEAGRRATELKCTFGWHLQVVHWGRTITARCPGPQQSSWRADSPGAC